MSASILNACWRTPGASGPDELSSQPICAVESEQKRSPMRSPPLSCSLYDRGREAEAHLAVDLAGGRTTLRRQRVGYPLHVTRGFYLDAARPDLLTLYLQSASGGLYAGDRITLDVTVGAGAAFHLTTQASTIVHA